MFDSILLLVLTAGVLVASFALSPRMSGIDGFYDGRNAQGMAPGLWTLVLSQVTTWIFARSLLTAAVLGFYYGTPGAMAYAAYYFSFLTGGLIIDRLRFKHGHGSIQAFLSERFGGTGTACYNFVIGLRLVSEVFANLLVVGTIFTATFGASLFGGVFGDAIGDSGGLAILVLAAVGMGYSMLGGLRASLRTDVMQMILFLVVFGIAFIALVTHDTFDMGAALSAEGTAGALPGWVLLAVAGLQVLSYPMHDPVMMDRGLIADRKTTAWSFFHAFWISALCIFGFGLFGVQAGILAADGESMQAVWSRMFDPLILVAVNMALIVSAISTLDSTLSSASKLVVVDMGAMPRTVTSGRIVMALFMLAGLIFCFFGTQDLFGAVAVSGTASMYLAPVILFSVLGGARNVPVWSYVVSFLAAVSGAALYFMINGKKALGIEAMSMMGVEHKYTALLYICVAVLVIGCGAFAIGSMMRGDARERVA
jgi:Na+/proline symporter